MNAVVDKVLLDFDEYIKSSNTREERAIFQSAKLQSAALDGRLAGIEAAIIQLASSVRAKVS
jgi:hypothetical protein